MLTPAANFRLFRPIFRSRRSCWFHFLKLFSTTAAILSSACGIDRAYPSAHEALLFDRPYLMSADAPTAADVCAFPFLRFTTSHDPGDDDLFHGVLLDHLPGDFPGLAAWIGRMTAIPLG